MRRGEWGGATSTFRQVLNTAIVLALVGAVGYFATEVHRRQYRLVAVGRELVVERGRRLPFGFESYAPTERALAAAYAPLPLPSNADAPVTQVFEERDALDRALFGMLANWAREGIKRSDTAPVAVMYLKRADALPGLTEQQREELRQFRGTVALFGAERLVNEAVARLNEAREQVRMATGSRALHTPEAQRLLANLERYLASCVDGGAAEGAALAPGPTPTPTPAPGLGGVSEVPVPAPGVPAAPEPQREKRGD